MVNVIRRRLACLCYFVIVIVIVIVIVNVIVIYSSSLTSGMTDRYGSVGVICNVFGLYYIISK